MKLFYLAGILFTLLSCHDSIDDKYTCPTLTIDLGKFLLDPTTKDIIPYKSGDRQLVFKNHIQQEFIFPLDSLRYVTHDWGELDDCPFDPTVQIPYTFSMENFYTGFHNDSIGLDVNVQYRTRFIREGEVITGEYDDFIAFVSAEPQQYYVSNDLRLVTNYGPLDSTEIQPVASLVINDKTFYNVYELEFAPGKKWKTYFNHEFGIVGFRHSSGYPVLALDRIE